MPDLTRADLDRLNERIAQLLDEGFPIPAAMDQARVEVWGIRDEDRRDGKLKITLLRASDDEAHQSPSFQQEIREFDSALKAEGIESNARWLVQDSEDAWCGYVGVIVITLPIVIRAVAPIIVAYIKRRPGRKVQIEFDGLKMKIEEPTEKEADRALTLVEQRQKEKRAKK